MPLQKLARFAAFSAALSLGACSNIRDLGLFGDTPEATEKTGGIAAKPASGFTPASLTELAERTRAAKGKSAALDPAPQKSLPAKSIPAKSAAAPARQPAKEARLQAQGLPDPARKSADVSAGKAAPVVLPKPKQAALPASEDGLPMEQIPVRAVAGAKTYRLDDDRSKAALSNESRQASLAPREGALEPKTVLQAIDKLRAIHAAANQPLPPNPASAGELDAQRAALKPWEKAPAADDEITTGSIGPLAAPRPADAPKTLAPALLLRFEKSDTALGPDSLKALGDYLAPHREVKALQVQIVAGLSGDGDAFTKLSRANARVQALADRMPAGSEVIRRFEPGLPGNTVKLHLIAPAAAMQAAKSP